MVRRASLYLTNFNRPYLLWAPLMLLAAIGSGAVRVAEPCRGGPGIRSRAGYGRLARSIQSPPAVVVFMLAQWAGAGGLLGAPGR